MLVAAGYGDAAAGRWTDGLVDEIIAWGPADLVAARIQALFDAGADEVLVRPIGAGPEPATLTVETMNAIAGMFS
jgi:hypothetical protein